MTKLNVITTNITFIDLASKTLVEKLVLLSEHIPTVISLFQSHAFSFIDFRKHKAGFHDDGGICIVFYSSGARQKRGKVHTFLTASSSSSHS
jgi:hypothetical protein